MITFLNEVREWTMLLMEAGILFYVGLEYHYDKAKDELKKQRKTKTTKRTIPQSTGGSIIEETTETSEFMNTVPKCEHMNTNFDRTLQEDGKMHTYCNDCGKRLD